MVITETKREQTPCTNFKAPSSFLKCAQAETLPKRK